MNAADTLDAMANMQW